MLPCNLPIGRLPAGNYHGVAQWTAQMDDDGLDDGAWGRMRVVWREWVLGRLLGQQQRLDASFRHHLVSSMSRTKG